MPVAVSPCRRRPLCRQAYQRLQIQQQMLQAQRNVSGPMRQQEQQVGAVRGSAGPWARVLAAPGDTHGWAGPLSWVFLPLGLPFHEA